MSVHRDCGEEIKWARRADDDTRWNPPLEWAGMAYIVDESGAAIQVTTYQIHHCDPDKMAVWQERCRRVAELKGGDMNALEVRAIKADLEREQVWELVLPHDCPTCSAKAGEKCHSMERRFVNRNEIKEILNPHPGRLELANQEV